MSGVAHARARTIPDMVRHVRSRHASMMSTYWTARASGRAIDPPPTLAEMVDRAMNAVAAELAGAPGAEETIARVRALLLDELEATARRAPEEPS